MDAGFCLVHLVDSGKLPSKLMVVLRFHLLRIWGEKSAEGGIVYSSIDPISVVGRIDHFRYSVGNWLERLRVFHYSSNPTPICYLVEGLLIAELSLMMLSLLVVNAEKEWGKQ